LKANLEKLEGVTSADITVTRSGYCPYGCKWVVKFVGLPAPVEITEKDKTALTSDPKITPTVAVKMLK
jgi:hypothetical protein